MKHVICVHMPLPVCFVYVGFSSVLLVLVVGMAFYTTTKKKKQKKNPQLNPKQCPMSLHAFSVCFRTPASSVLDLVSLQDLRR